jgi:carboxymethylenebutenolidase
MASADDTHDLAPDLAAETVTVSVPDGAGVHALLYLPSAPGPHPGITVGMEATGINHFIRDVGARLAGLGYVTIIPDYYRGGGPPDPEDYEDIDAIMPHTFALDFPRAARDLIAAADILRGRDDVDGARVGYWGYCTGATVALLAACLDRLSAIAVGFYPSQPRFSELTPQRPAHLVDLLWLLTCPTLIIYGDDDIVMPVEALEDLRERLTRWEVDHELRIYAGAGHAFSAPSPSYYHADAAAASWADAVDYLRRHLPT